MVKPVNFLSDMERFGLMELDTVISVGKRNKAKVYKAAMDRVK
jgi:hypothetical protein